MLQGELQFRTFVSTAFGDVAGLALQEQIGNEVLQRHPARCRRTVRGIDEQIAKSEKQIADMIGLWDRPQSCSPKFPLI